MVVSAVFFLDGQGNPLLSRNYRGDIPMSTVEAFPSLLLQAEELSGAQPPCLTHQGINVGRCREIGNHKIRAVKLT